eukprot:jgi/Mesvir1/24256/Mv10958-RA.1
MSKSSLRQSCDGAPGVESLLLSALETNSHLVRHHADKSVVFVGSSWSLHGKGLGPVIDSFDLVVRINSAPVRGFEHDVGRKTTHRCLSSVKGACFGDPDCSAAAASRYWQLNEGVKILPMSPRLAGTLLQGLHKSRRKARHMSEPIDCMRACPKVVALWLRLASKKAPRLRSRLLVAQGLRAGFCCLFAFVSAGFAPVVAGFDLSCTPNVGPEYYYAPHSVNRCMSNSPGAHDYVGETEIMRGLAEAGLITMLT